jgi:plasmid stabilization system protein ParE
MSIDGTREARGLMRKIRLHPRAESDLIDIWGYSFERWDDVQADKYLDELTAAINSLATNPYLRVRRDNVREGCRALFVNIVRFITG